MTIINRQKRIFHLILISILLIGIKPSLIYGQNTDKNNSEILHFYTYGLLGFEAEYDYICKNNLNIKYGFDYEIVAGCVVKKRDVKKWERHNRKVERKLEK